MLVSSKKHSKYIFTNLEACYHIISFNISFKNESKLASFLNKILIVYALFCGSYDCARSNQNSKSKQSPIPSFSVRKTWLKTDQFLLTLFTLFAFTNASEENHDSNDIHFVKKIIYLFQRWYNIAISPYINGNTIGPHVSLNYSIL